METVPGTETATATKDQFNSMSFPSLKTTALRIEADLQPGFPAAFWNGASNLSRKTPEIISPTTVL